TTGAQVHGPSRAAQGSEAVRLEIPRRIVGSQPTVEDGEVPAPHLCPGVGATEAVKVVTGSRHRLSSVISCPSRLPGRRMPARPEGHHHCPDPPAPRRRTHAVRCARAGSPRPGPGTRTPG